MNLISIRIPISCIWYRNTDSFNNKKSNTIIMYVSSFLNVITRIQFRCCSIVPLVYISLKLNIFFIGFVTKCWQLFISNCWVVSQSVWLMHIIFTMHFHKDISKLFSSVSINWLTLSILRYTKAFNRSQPFEHKTKFIKVIY